jgi:hypothetical protein
MREEADERVGVTLKVGEVLVVV